MTWSLRGAEFSVTFPSVEDFGKSMLALQCVPSKASDK